MNGVTKERIRQIEAKALRKLRHPERRKFTNSFGAWPIMLTRTGFKRTPYKRPRCRHHAASSARCAGRHQYHRRGHPRQPARENPHLRDMAKKYGCNLHDFAVP